MIAIRRILVPIDFGESSKGALDIAVELSQKLGASLTLVHISEIPSYLYPGMAFATVDLLAPLLEVAREQLDAVRLLQRAHVHAHGRLADPERLRGVGEAPGHGDGMEGAELRVRRGRRRSGTGHQRSLYRTSEQLPGTMTADPPDCRA